MRSCKVPPPDSLQLVPVNTDAAETSSVNARPAAVNASIADIANGRRAGQWKGLECRCAMIDSSPT
jgi:hypothetical protein